jgi:hypothetical protein
MIFSFVLSAGAAGERAVEEREDQREQLVGAVSR